MKIGIFGGSFNPPHKMHEDIAKELINKHIVDKVIFVPTGSQYQYKNNLKEPQKRYEMLKLITDKDERLAVSDYELKEYVVYTYETLAYFKNKYPNDEIYFICGTDNLSYIDKWKNGKEILEKYKILVIDRKGNDLAELLEKFQEYKDNIVVTTVEPRDLSSTKIRELIQEGKKKDLKNLIDEDVFNYIEKNHLYQK